MGPSLHGHAVEDHIFLLGDNTVLVDYGPMRMFIDGYIRGLRQPDICIKAAGKALEFLKEIAERKHLVQSLFHTVDEPPRDSLTNVMWRAVSLIGDMDLTPMAAVAGTIADAVVDFLEAQGLTKIIVNNGGDLAVRLKGEETLSVGIRPDIEKNTLSHKIVIAPEMQIGGICTSGLGGRSFTRGIASAATVFAGRAAVADAAATSIANATYMQSPAVSRVPADSLDPNTDLNGIDVTVRVDDLSAEEVETSLQQGIRKSEELAGLGIISGACVAVKGTMRCTGRISPLLEAT